MSSQVESTTTTEKKTKKVGTKKTTVETVTPVVTITTENLTPIVTPTLTVTPTVTLTETPTVTVESENVLTVDETTSTSNSNEEVSKQLLEQFNELSDRIADFSKNMRNISFDSKDTRIKFETTFRKFGKATSQITVGYPELINRQLTFAEKSSHGKSSTKKPTNKEKSAVNKKLEVDENLLSFMSLPTGTLVSRAEALQAITGYVKTIKESGNIDIKVEGNNKAFKIIGKLQTLFKGIEKVMLDTGDLKKGESVPDTITYIQIMKYMNYCFKKSTTPKPTVV